MDRQTDSHMDEGDCITSLANAVSNKYKYNAITVINSTIFFEVKRKMFNKLFLQYTSDKTGK